MAEQDAEITIALRIRTFGNPEKVREEMLRRVARAVCLQGTPDFDIALLPHGLWPEPMPQGHGPDWKRYDKFADDSGHHEDHTEILRAIRQTP